ncbi:MAG TPA: hypothetical protein VNF07_01025 [Acidimicrobiales bacterium]|nr:hypothetical protein [Acidimicrobiales bacterium]
MYGRGSKEEGATELSLFLIAVVVGGVLWVATAVTGVAGLIAAVFGERFERCPRCEHYAMTVGGLAHPQGCPAERHGRLEHHRTSRHHGLPLLHH